MITFMFAERGESAEQPHASLIIVGVDDSAEAEAAAKWAVREAELRMDDVLLVHAYEVPLLPPRGKAAAVAQGAESAKRCWTRWRAPWQYRRGCISTSSSKWTALSPYCPGCPRALNLRCSAKIIGPSVDGCHWGKRPAQSPACRGIQW